VTDAAASPTPAPASPAPLATPRRGPSPLKQLLDVLSSLQLTVVLIALSMALVFTGTWAQREDSVWRVQKEYFHSFFVYVRFWHLWLPAGWTIGGLMMINLLAAHATRFKLRRDRIGIILIHLGLILLLVGELLTGTFARETNMEISEGEAVNYSFSLREFELAFVDPTDPASDQVVVVGDRALRAAAGTDQPIEDPALPAQVLVERWLSNSSLQPLRPGEGADVTQGTGLRVRAQETAEVAGASEGIDIPSAVVGLRAKDGRPLGTWLVSPMLSASQEVALDGKTWLVDLRFRRHYKPYWMKLDDFRFDRYTGTEVAKNFSSDVRLIDPERKEDRTVKIYMNNPLRYEGETFYQASFDRATERKTVLQVVKNPAWTMPYVAVTVGALGMCIHFASGLLRFLRRQAKKAVPA
jgi:hypothetical protein